MLKVIACKPDEYLDLRAEYEAKGYVEVTYMEGQTLYVVSFQRRP